MDLFQLGKGLLVTSLLICNNLRFLRRQLALQLQHETLIVLLLLGRSIVLGQITKEDQGRKQHQHRSPTIHNQYFVALVAEQTAVRPGREKRRQLCLFQLQTVTPDKHKDRSGSADPRKQSGKNGAERKA